jgi:hypothetical protein
VNSCSDKCIPVLRGGFLFSFVDACSHGWIPVLVGGFLFSRVDSCSRVWIPVLICGFLFSLVDFCSRFRIPVLRGVFLFSWVDSCSHWSQVTGACECPVERNGDHCQNALMRACKLRNGIQSPCQSDTRGYAPTCECAAECDRTGAAQYTAQCLIRRELLVNASGDQLTHTIDGDPPGVERVRTTDMV